jgi:hypothetical protein
MVAFIAERFAQPDHVFAPTEIVDSMTDRTIDLDV